MLSPPPEPSPIKGEGGCCVPRLAKYLPLFPARGEEMWVERDSVGEGDMLLDRPRRFELVDLLVVIAQRVQHFACVLSQCRRR
jgi:hypothetical protein